MTTVSPIRILFVDDEAEILDGLRARLRKHRRRWHMRFADSGDDALTLLGEESADIVVTDMRMPGMDGAELLCAVREQHPQIARLVLSGYAEQDMILRALPVAHRFLAKPCELAVLEEAIERLHALTRHLNDDDVDAALTAIGGLPVMPDAYVHLLDALQNHADDIEIISKAIAADPAMAARLLQTVNAPLFGAQRNIDTVPEAVTRLGLNIVQALAIREYLGDRLAVDDAQGQVWLRRIDRHCQAVAQIATDLAPVDQRGLAYTAGLLHDIGKLVLLANDRQRFLDTANAAAASGGRWSPIERDHFGIDHATIGARLLDLWGLPPAVVAAVDGHACESIADSDDVAVVIAAADHVQHQLCTGADDATLLKELPERLQHRYQSADRDAWRALCKVEEAA